MQNAAHQLKVRLSGSTRGWLDGMAQEGHCSTNAVVLRALDLLRITTERVKRSEGLWLAARTYVDTLPPEHRGEIGFNFVDGGVEIVRVTPQKDEILLAVIRGDSKIYKHHAHA